MSIKLEDDKMCYVCGDQNPAGLKLKFNYVPGASLESYFTFKSEHQGFKGVVHGGMLAMVLDDLMVNFCWREGIAAVTGELKTRLKKPALVGEPIRFRVFYADQPKMKLVYLSGEAHDSKKELLLTCKGICVPVKDGFLR